MQMTFKGMPFLEMLKGLQQIFILATLQSSGIYSFDLSIILSFDHFYFMMINQTLCLILLPF